MSESKKRKKSYYTQAKKHCMGRQLLDVGMKGFLITCNQMEKQAVREAYNLLNEYKQLLYGEDAKGETISEHTDAENAEVDFDKLISSQVEAIQSTKHASGTAAAPERFQAVDTKTTNCIFIRAPSTLARPDEIVLRLLADAAETGTTKSRSILKIFPVLGTCRATEEKIEKLVEEIIAERQFSGGVDGTPWTFAILYKVRCNSLGREQILSCVGRAIFRASPDSRVDLKSPDYIVSVDVLNKFACVSIMHDFYRLKKYNLQELAASATDISGRSEKKAVAAAKSEDAAKTDDDGTKDDSVSAAVTEKSPEGRTEMENLVGDEHVSKSVEARDASDTESKTTAVAIVEPESSAC